jgi:hypothetical protein
MTKEEVIAMARESGYGDAIAVLHGSALERFAELIRNDYSYKHASLWLTRIKGAVGAEREACARVCDKYDDADPLGVSLECTNAIRARNQA